MMTVLQEIRKHPAYIPTVTGCQSMPHFPDDFKVIYVAPMKALAAEIVAKFSSRLGGLGISVRELTGISSYFFFHFEGFEDRQ